MNVLHTRWRALVLALLLAVSLAVPAAAAEPQAAAADLQTTADTAAAYAAQYGGAQSLQYALWQDGEIVLTGEAGTFSRSENRLMTGDELYGIGSVSKIYTTVAVMQLAEDGKVSLDAPVTRYLPDFKMADERYRDITVRMLLNHSSGILGTGLSDAMLFGEASTRAHDTLLEKLSTQRLAADPGAFSVYCNDGFSLAELVVEAVTDMDFMDYVDEHILAPLDLDRTFAPGGDFDANDLAPIYRGTDPRALPQDALNAIGAGGIYATASDLASFGGALTGTELLRQSSLDAMAYPEYSRGLWPESGEPDSLAYGLGWDNMEWYPFCQSDIQALVKGGDTLYYHAGLVVLPEYDMAAAVVSSGGVSTYDQLAANQILIAALAEEGVTVDQTVKALPAAESAAMPAEQLENAGYYGSTSAQYQVDIQADGTLTMSYLNYPTSIPAPGPDPRAKRRRASGIPFGGATWARQIQHHTAGFWGVVVFPDFPSTRWHPHAFFLPLLPPPFCFQPPSAFPLKFFSQIYITFSPFPFFPPPPASPPSIFHPLLFFPPLLFYLVSFFLFFFPPFYFFFFFPPFFLPPPPATYFPSFFFFPVFPPFFIFFPPLFFFFPFPFPPPNPSPPPPPPFFTPTLLPPLSLPLFHSHFSASSHMHTHPFQGCTHMGGGQPPTHPPSPLHFFLFPHPLPPTPFFAFTSFFPPPTGLSSYPL